MTRILDLFSHTSIQLRFVSLLSSSVLFALGILLGFFSWAGLLLGTILGLLTGILFWYETRETLYKEGQFPVTATQKFSYVLLCCLYAVFLGCLVETFQRFPSSSWVTESLGMCLYGALGFLLTYTLTQFVRLSHFLVQGGVLDRSIWKERETGMEGMIGSIGFVMDALCPTGKVFVHGEIWNAETEGTAALEQGTKVVVKRMVGLTLYVVPASMAKGSGTASSPRGSTPETGESHEAVDEDGEAR